MLTSFRKDRAGIWLAIALAINGLFLLTTTVCLIVTGKSIMDARKATAFVYDRGLLRSDTNGLDSWQPMIMAYNRYAVNPEGGVYGIFFDGKDKFQYPPTALLILDQFPPSMVTININGKFDEKFRRYVGRTSQLAGFAAIAVSILILEFGLRRHFAMSLPGDDSILLHMVLASLIGFTFYPLAKAHNLGQIQIYLIVLVACAVLFYMLGWRAMSGICIGLCCLVKPQFGVVLLWGLIRRNWSFSIAMGVIIAVGLGFSLGQFGWSNHVDYLTVLRTVGRQGEAYWPNQSVNGLLNRFLLNGNPLRFSMHEYAPYSTLVYVGTMISSMTILVLAFWPSRCAEQSSIYHLIDFLIILLAVTMASPIAWEHHYGILLPICAALFPILLYVLPFGRWTGLVFAIGFTAVANVVLRPDVIFANRWMGLMGSHLFFGSFIIFILLLATRSRAVIAETPMG